MPLQETSMKKPLWTAALVSVALSGAVFAQSSSESMSSGGAALSGHTAMQITESDCQMLTVSSARNACMRSSRAQMGTGATGDRTATGSVRGGHSGKRMHKRSKNQSAHSSGGETTQ
jgi:hypothetical protein